MYVIIIKEAISVWKQFLNCLFPSPYFLQPPVSEQDA